MEPKIKDRFVYVHPDGRILWGTESSSEQNAAAKALMMDVPSGGRVEKVAQQDYQ